MGLVLLLSSIYVILSASPLQNILTTALPARPQNQASMQHRAVAIHMGHDFCLALLHNGTISVKPAFSSNEAIGLFKRWVTGAHRPTVLLRDHPGWVYPYPPALDRLGGRRWRTYPHHMAHAASGFYDSPFAQALVLVLDGGGDDKSVTMQVLWPVESSWLCFMLPMLPACPVFVPVILQCPR